MVWHVSTSSCVHTTPHLLHFLQNNPLAIDLLAKTLYSRIESLQEEVSQLQSSVQEGQAEHSAEVARLQEALLKKDGYIASIKEEQYRQEREISQLEEVVFEKKQTRQKVG